MGRVSFNNKPNPFSQALKEKVDAYFEEKKLLSTGNTYLFLKNIFLLASFIGLYTVLVFFTPVSWIALPLCALMGINLALIGFNIMHEGGHGSISKYKWLNKMAAYTLNLMGGNAHFWKLVHNVTHHTYTNIDGEDNDINLKPFMRLSETQPLRWYHRYQYVYWVFLYGFSYINWVTWNDFKKYFSRRMGAGAEKQKFKLKDHLIFWGTKVFYFFMYVTLPMMIIGVGEMLIGYAVLTLVCGFFLSIVFQLAHTVEHTQFPTACKVSNKVEQEWAIHQVVTTANFATKNKVLVWMLGGLNFQVEHHLFPRVSHIYYSDLRPLVKETCTEFGVDYNEYPTLTQAIKSHVVYLKKMGQRPQQLN